MISYTATQKTAMPPRDDGPMQCKVRPENLLALLQNQGHQRFSLNDLVSWQIHSAPAAARLAHPAETILQVERDMVHEFLRARGIETQEPTAKLAPSDVHAAILAKGSEVPLEDVTAWLDGNGRQYSAVYVDASKLPTVANSAAVHYLRSCKK